MIRIGHSRRTIAHEVALGRVVELVDVHELVEQPQRDYTVEQRRQLTGGTSSFSAKAPAVVGPVSLSVTNTRIDHHPITDSDIVDLRADR